jgi:hypothetical protein
MAVIKLSREHVEAVKPLFSSTKYMGLDINDTKELHANKNFKGDPVETFNTLLYNIFCSNYLSDLKAFKAFGYQNEQTGNIDAIISFYQSFEEPSWYYTLYRSAGDNNKLRGVLDEVIKYNENDGRYKFYTLVQSDHSKLLRRFHWSKYNDERYGYFDEFVVPKNTKCYYTNAWELLFKRFIVPADTIVRCNYLKQEYRLDLPKGGNI